RPGGCEPGVAGGRGGAVVLEGARLPVLSRQEVKPSDSAQILSCGGRAMSRSASLTAAPLPKRRRVGPMKTERITGDQRTAGKRQYQQAERLARDADRNGAPLPVTLLEQAAASGYPPALYALANWHLHGKGVKRDYKRAVGLLKKAAAKKHPAAEYDLAVCHELGKGGLAKDPRAALIWYRRAANHGDRDAITEVAR